MERRTNSNTGKLVGRRQLTRVKPPGRTRVTVLAYQQSLIYKSIRWTRRSRALARDSVSIGSSKLSQKGSGEPSYSEQGGLIRTLNEPKGGCHSRAQARPNMDQQGTTRPKSRHPTQTRTEATQIRAESTATARLGTAWYAHKAGLDRFASVSRAPLSPLDRPARPELRRSRRRSLFRRTHHHPQHAL